MSDVVEGLVSVRPPARVESALAAIDTDLRFRVRQLDRYSIAERLAGRDDTFSPQLPRVAADLSTRLGPVVLFQYDSRVAFREAYCFTAGVLTASFSEADEQWVPLAQDGQPVLHAPRLRVSQLSPTEEYETVMNAIDLALEQLSGHDLRWEDVHDCLSED